MQIFKPLILTLSLAGCSVPIVQTDANQSVAARYTTAAPPASQRLDVDWWTRTGDASLTELLTLARTQSPDLRTAAARVMSARARVGQSTSDLYPELTGEASATVSDSEDSARTETSRVGLDASWEIDLFASARNGTAAERARARSEDASYSGAYVTLAAEVADTYVQYRACRMTERIYSETLTSRRGSLNSTRELSGSGLAPQSDLALARASVATSEISLESQRADCRVLAQTLATVVGVEQTRIDAILSKGGGLPGAKPFAVTPIPSEMLRQRPDVVAAEYDLAAELLDLKVAQADLYPSLRLNGSVTLTDPSSWSFGPVLSLPIFDAGARRASVRSANADAIIAAEAYRAAVLTAVAEVEGALTRLSAARANVGSASTLVSQYQVYFEAIDQEWRAGGTTLLDREEAIRQLQSARVTQIAQREAQIRQWIALYKAVGGGWIRPADPAGKV